MSSSQQSISIPLVVGEPLVGGFPTDMDVDDDNLALLDAHDTPSEKVDADFFNGELCHCARTLTPRATRLAPPAQQGSAPSGTHVFLPTCPPQISRTTSTTTTWNEWHMRAYVRETLAQACLLSTLVCRSLASSSTYSGYTAMWQVCILYTYTYFTQVHPHEPVNSPVTCSEASPKPLSLRSARSICGVWGRRDRRDGADAPRSSTSLGGLASPRARARACRVRVPGRRGGRVAGIREWGERRETRERGKCGKLISLFGSVSDVCDLHLAQCVFGAL